MAKKGKKQKKKRSAAAVRAGFIMKILLLVILLTLLLLGIVFYVKYGRQILKLQQEAKTLVWQSDENTFRQTETSLVYDRNNKLISVLKGEKDLYYIEYEDIPPSAVDAMISIEDKKFYRHGGVDLVANVRAVMALIKHKGKITQGASTITQQLARNIFLTQEVSWERKVKEIFVATEIEKKYEKYQILEYYLNNVYFANGYYGIQAASKGYFSKDVNKLSLSQITFLCAIPNNPTIYDPMDYKENTIKRRDRILEQMKKDGKISQTEYTEAVNEEIKLQQKSISKKNYVETFVNYSATRALMEQQGFVFRYEFDSKKDKEEYDELYSEFYNRCQQSLFSGGYRIYTSIDLTKQKNLQKTVDEELAGFKEKSKDGIYKLQGAAVCIENETGRVTAIVGGRSQKTVGYTLNRAYQSFRQPGSSIKPLVVYTPAFERDYTPDTIVVDERIEEGPRNSDGVFSGRMTVRTAVAKSKNTIAWKLFEELTPQVGLSYLKKMNFSRITDSDNVPAAALGGLTVGTSPVEMTSAFATIENDGKFREPTCIVKIVDSKGEIFTDDRVMEKAIYEKNASRIMTDVLQSVMKEGTGRYLRLSGMTCAGKTGTTTDKKDGWFVGYTPYYTTGVWVGYDIPQSMSDLSGSSYPGRIWKTYMEWLHQDLEDKAFPAYEGKKEPVKIPEPEPTIDEGGSFLGTEEPRETEEPTEEPIEEPTEEPDPGLPGGEEESPEPTIPPEETEPPVDDELGNNPGYEGDMNVENGDEVTVEPDSTPTP